eukprot:2624693-Pleurochrysis_carterae.AAC.1
MKRLRHRFRDFPSRLMPQFHFDQQIPTRPSIRSFAPLPPTLRLCLDAGARARLSADAQPDEQGVVAAVAEPAAAHARRACRRLPLRCAPRQDGPRAGKPREARRRAARRRADGAAPRTRDEPRAQPPAGAPPPSPRFTPQRLARFGEQGHSIPQPGLSYLTCPALYANQSAQSDQCLCCDVKQTSRRRRGAGPRGAPRDGGLHGAAAQHARGEASLGARRSTVAETLRRQLTLPRAHRVPSFLLLHHLDRTSLANFSPLANLHTPLPAHSYSRL